MPIRNSKYLLDPILTGLQDRLASLHKQYEDLSMITLEEDIKSAALHLLTLEIQKTEIKIDIHKAENRKRNLKNEILSRMTDMVCEMLEGE